MHFKPKVLPGFDLETHIRQLEAARQAEEEKALSNPKNYRGGKLIYTRTHTTPDGKTVARQINKMTPARASEAEDMLRKLIRDYPGATLADMITVTAVKLNLETVAVARMARNVLWIYNQREAARTVKVEAVTEMAKTVATTVAAAAEKELEVNSVDVPKPDLTNE